MDSLHQVAVDTPSYVPLQRRAIIIDIFLSSGTNCMVPSDWDLALKCVCGPNLISIQPDSPVFLATSLRIASLEGEALLCGPQGGYWPDVHFLPWDSYLF